MANTRSNIGGHAADTSTAVLGSTIAQTVNPAKVTHSCMKKRLAEKRTLMTTWTLCGPIFIPCLAEFSAMKKEILRFKYIGHKTQELCASFLKIHQNVELSLIHLKVLSRKRQYNFSQLRTLQLYVFYYFRAFIRPL